MVAGELRLLRAADRGQAALHTARSFDQPWLCGAWHRGVVVQHRARRPARSVRSVQHRRGRGRLRRSVLRRSRDVVRSPATSGRSTATELRHALVDYFRSARRLALTLTEVFAVALAFPTAGSPRSSIARQPRCARIRYERRAGDADPLPGQQRMGAHTDYGIVTVLYAEPVAGLQIVAPDGDGST